MKRRYMLAVKLNGGRQPTQTRLTESDKDACFCMLCKRSEALWTLQCDFFHSHNVPGMGPGLRQHCTVGHSMVDASTLLSVGIGAATSVGGCE